MFFIIRHLNVDLPQVDHFCVAIVLERETKSRDEQREEKSWAVDLFHLQEFKSD